MLIWDRIHQNIIGIWFLGKENDVALEEWMCPTNI